MPVRPMLRVRSTAKPYPMHLNAKATALHGSVMYPPVLRDNMIQVTPLKN